MGMKSIVLSAVVAVALAPSMALADSEDVGNDWGSNWGYQVPKEHRHFAHALIDKGGWAARLS